MKLSIFRSPWVRAGLGICLILLLAWLVVSSPLFTKTAPPGVELTDLQSVSQLQSRFKAASMRIKA